MLGELVMRHVSFLSAALLLAGLTPAVAQYAGQAEPRPTYQGPTYQGGVGAPFSPNASNIDGADTRSDVAPRLPDPDANGDGPRAYLAAAQRALADHQTGAAQEALERAQTRILTRATDPTLADTPDTRGVTRAITDARHALANHDIPRAQAILAQVLAPER
jgi:hypothetical protein